MALVVIAGFVAGRTDPPGIADAFVGAWQREPRSGHVCAMEALLGRFHDGNKSPHGSSCQQLQLSGDAR